MNETKTPREWALELGLLELRRPVGGQALLGEEEVEVPSTSYAAARALHQWDQDEYHATPDREVDGKLVKGGRLRVTREVFEAALEAGSELVETDEGLVHLPVAEALGKHTPDAVLERALRLRSSTTKVGE